MKEAHPEGGTVVQGKMKRKEIWETYKKKKPRIM